jgi:hypothetical protein
VDRAGNAGLAADSAVVVRDVERVTGENVLGGAVTVAAAHPNAPLNLARRDRWSSSGTRSGSPPAQETADGLLVHVQGLGEPVRDTTASFYASLDTSTPLDPAAACVVADASPQYGTARLWLESTFRKTPVPLGGDGTPRPARPTASSRPVRHPLRMVARMSGLDDSAVADIDRQTWNPHTRRWYGR